MSPEQRKEWNSRPTETRVLDLCPRCKTLQENVEKRTIYGPWGQRFEETCCAACVPAVKAEYEVSVYC
jgi:hypothetical protein